MTTSKSIFTRYWLLSILVQALAIAFLGLPALEPHREALAANLGLQTEAIWVIVAAALLAIMIMILGRLKTVLAEPLRKIAAQCTSGNQTPSHRDPQSREEKIIRDFLQQQYDRSKTMATKLEKTENELSATIRERDRAVKKREEAEDLLANFARIRQELSIDIASLKTEKQALTEELEAERQANVGAEIEERTDEIYSQMERAISATALKSIWLPRLLADLRTPVNIIQGLAHRMLKSWESTSLGQLRENAEEIYFQSEVQLKRINDILDRENKTIPISRNGERNPYSAKPVELTQTHQAKLRESSSSLQEFLDTIGTERITTSDLIADELDSLSFDGKAQDKFRSFVSDIRNRLETSAIELDVDCNEHLEPLFEFTVQGTTENGERLDSDELNRLADKNGIEAEDCESIGSQLKIRCSTASAPRREEPRAAMKNG